MARGVQHREDFEYSQIQRGDDAMNRYAAGDDRAFADLYAVLSPLLTRYLGRRVRDSAAVPDLVQETLLRVHLARRSFVPGSPVIPWVLTIARRQMIDAHRRRPHEERADNRRLDRLTFHNIADSLPGAEAIVAANEVATHLDHALGSLSEPQRAALRLVKGEGLSIQQAAAALGTTTTGVKLRTHRARQLLRAKLATLAAA
jgi:RNA polymerase sigma-70 factor (ECF subfamily)